MYDFCIIFSVLGTKLARNQLILTERRFFGHYWTIQISVQGRGKEWKSIRVEGQSVIEGHLIEQVLLLFHPKSEGEGLSRVSPAIPVPTALSSCWLAARLGEWVSSWNVLIALKTSIIEFLVMNPMANGNIGVLNPWIQNKVWWQNLAIFVSTS